MSDLSGRADTGDGDPMTDADEIRAFYDATTDRMRAILDFLARHPDQRFTNPQVEEALGWAALSVRGTAAASTRRLGATAFGGRMPYHWRDGGPRSRSGRFEIWMSADQARAIHGSD